MSGVQAPRILEVAANSAASALAAQAGGAHRIELCENLGQGGTTPSCGSIAVARERLRIPLYVLIRPRAGDFLYHAQEAEVMLRDIELCVRLGCDGVVIGALDAQGDLDLPLCRQLMAAAGPLGVTFHRAFDVARDPAQALEQIIALGCERVLTSGACASAEQGADAIARYRLQADGRLKIMAGAGISAANLATVARRSGVAEFHASAKAWCESPMQRNGSALPGLEGEHMQTSTGQVIALREALQAY